MQQSQAGDKVAAAKDYDAAGSHHSYDHDGDDDYDSHEQHSEWPDYRSDNRLYGDQSPQANGHDGYSVASGHDYLGYPKDQRGYSNDQMWEDEESEDLW